MGLSDAMKNLGDAVAEGQAGVKDDDRYMVEVSSGAVDARALGHTFNQRWEAGWRLAHVYSQASNTVMVWERKA
jgi:hypothetical protein